MTLEALRVGAWWDVFRSLGCAFAGNRGSPASFLFLFWVTNNDGTILICYALPPRAACCLVTGLGPPNSGIYSLRSFVIVIERWLTLTTTKRTVRAPCELSLPTGLWGLQFQGPSSGMLVDNWQLTGWKTDIEVANNLAHSKYLLEAHEEEKTYCVLGLRLTLLLAYCSLLLQQDSISVAADWSANLTSGPDWGGLPRGQAFC